MRLALLVSTAVAITIVATSADATTVPSLLVPVHVSLTVRSVAMSPRFAPRGSTVEFGVRNRTAHARMFAVAGKRIVIPARRLRFLGLQFDRRGRYAYVSRGPGDVVRGTFRIS